ncbi:ATP-dependent Clp protease ATP-binding subunit [Treponema sp. OMZ 840]|uniref:ATP-dependent Clp protease ATP-binding subunit n=1 Tax=Treponema sp. OMZ 840 TaxID=244313 RepID=UPI003D901B10
MIKGLSPRAHKLLNVYAQEEGKRSGADEILPEHVLLALIKSSSGLGFAVLQFLKINLLTFQLALEQVIPLKSPVSAFSDIAPSRRLRTMFDIAAVESRSLRRDYIGTEHLLLAAIREEQSLCALFFKKAGIGLDSVRRAVEAASVQIPSSAYDAKNTGTNIKPVNFGQSKQLQQTSLLKEFSRDLTDAAKNGCLDPVVGRKNEIRRVIQILSRRGKNNPILVGEPGVGKTAIVEGLAAAIVEEKVPAGLIGKRLLTLDLALVIAGTKYRGEFEERLKRIMKEIHEAKNVILFIDELHTIIGAGSGEGTMDASNMIKPALSRGELQCIGATTLKEYRKYFEKDAALERRFQIVHIHEPTEEQTTEILEGIKSGYEEFHGIRYADGVIESIVKFSKRYIADRFLPDKAIDLLDETGAMKKIQDDSRPAELAEIEKRIYALTEEKQLMVQDQDYEGAAKIRDQVYSLRTELETLRKQWRSSSAQNTVQIEDVCSVVAGMTGIPVEQLNASETSRLMNMEEELHRFVIGQNEAVCAVCSAVRRARSGVSSVKRPLGSFIFLGPTGVGKTLLAKSLARFLFGSEDALIRIDMSDYMEKHNASRLVGAPPGYIGYEDGGILTEKIRKNPYSIVLLDEIEKAHPDVFNLLLQVLEEGELSDNSGHKINFKNTLIIMTSNAGVRRISNENRLGFNASNKAIMDYANIKADALNELKQILSPELLNRIDDTVVFTPLSDKEVSGVLDIQIEELKERLAEQNIYLELLPKARSYFIENGYEPAFGARPMRRLIQHEVEDVLASKIIAGECTAGDTLLIDCKKIKSGTVLHLRIKKAKLELTAPALSIEAPEKNAAHTLQ